MSPSPGDSVTLLLADDLDLSRGDLISGVADAPEPVTEFTATITQLAERPLRAGTRALLRYGTVDHQGGRQSRSITCWRSTP